MSRFGAWVEPVRGDSSFLHKERARERAEELEGIVYWDLFYQIEADQKTEYESDFGEEYRAKHPFKPNSTAIHNAVIAKMKSNHEETTK